MPDAYKGSDAVFKFGPSSTNLTTISGANSGFDGFTLTPTAETRAIPGGTDTYRQLNGVKDWSGEFTVDANATTWPLLANKVGAEVHFEFSPIGTASGTLKVNGKGIASVPIPSPSGDVIRFTVNIEGNGPLTIGTN